jgi:hypothetical protein
MASRRNHVAEAAREAQAAGFSVIPVSDKPKQKKQPAVKWKPYQTTPADTAQVEEWFGPHKGLGLVCGQVSGGLELLEFELEETYNRFLVLAVNLGLADLVKRVEQGYLEQTPGQGFHWLYRCEEIRGNTKLASRPGPDGTVKVLIETRGEGGYVIVAPSLGDVHPTGRPYTRFSGGFDTIATITPEERDQLWHVAQSLDEMPAPQESSAEREQASRAPSKAPGGPYAVLPGDYYNAVVDWADVLKGWTKVHTTNDSVSHWRRPGKTQGTSATTNHGGSDRFRCFSTSTNFKTTESYSKFAAYALLEHGGDFSKASKALQELGYGVRNEGSGKNGSAARTRQPVKSARAQPQPNGQPQGSLGSLTDTELGLVKAGSLKGESIQWLWPHHIALGKFNLVAGDGGDGKSQYAIRLIAAITTGGLFPDESGPAEPGDCLILAAEDGLRDTIIPRLLAAGADVDHVTIVTARVTTKKDDKVFIHPMSFQDLDYWQTVLSRVPGARLLVADPLPAYLGRGVNDHKNNEVRAVLEPFISVIDQARIALVGITHLGKSPDLKTPSHKILGSVAYANIARTVHVTVKDPADRARRFLCQIKSNFGSLQPALAFRIIEKQVSQDEDTICSSCAEFEPGSSDIDPGELMAAGNQARRKPGPVPLRTTQVAEWLFDLLDKEAEPIPVGRIWDLAGAQGFVGQQSEKTGRWSNPNGLYRAKDLIETLPDPRDGMVVAESEVETSRGKVVKRWTLAMIPPPGART